MARLNAANNARTTLSANINASQTSFNVASGAVFPEPPFKITVSNEIMEVGAISGNTLSNVLRGQEGTAAASHSAGAIVENRLTAGAYNELATQAEVDAHKADGTQHAKVARFIIGTSTAGWTTADCDYLCDGTADQAEINAAITALPATGGEIVILDGTYNITEKIDVTKDNVSIVGNGNATILKRMYESFYAEGVITLTGRSGCKIANLQVDGNKEIYDYGPCDGIYLSSSSNNTITSNTCNNGAGSGISLSSSSSSNTVTGNICNDNSSGIRLVSSNNNNTVTGNTCNNNDSSGISLSSSSNNTVTSNTCNNNGFGISLYSSNDNTITGNTCYNTNESGISLGSSSSNTITGNTCNNHKHGIQLNASSNDNTVTCNTCYNNSLSGIYLHSSSSNTVTGNNCNNNNYGHGIDLSYSSSNTVTGNTCNDNNKSGIHLYYANNNTVTGNTCVRGDGLATDYTESQYTIQLSATDNNYNLISNNNCMGKNVVIGGGTSNTSVNNKDS